MELQPKQPSAKGPAERFTGDVWYDVIASGEAPSRVRVNIVRFTPGARNAWHAHALGQTLHVTEGVGLIQSRGDQVIQIRPGDTIYTPPRRMALARRRPRPLHDPPGHLGGARLRTGVGVGQSRHRRGVPERARHGLALIGGGHSGTAVGRLVSVPASVHQPAPDGTWAVSLMGHEFLGVVEEVGSQVSGLKAGDLVVTPFTWADNTCDFCRKGLHTSCRHGGRYGLDGVDGGQGQAVRVPQAQGTLVKLPVAEDSPLLPSLLTLSDVLCTGHHGAIKAGVTPGDTVTIIGDGASVCPRSWPPSGSAPNRSS